MALTSVSALSLPLTPFFRYRREHSRNASAQKPRGPFFCISSGGERFLPPEGLVLDAS